MFLLFSAALAEPPMPVSLPDAVAASELIIVATPQRVYFEALAPGESMKRSSHEDFWVEYRISSVLFGTSPVEPGQSLRIDFDPYGCERYDFEIHRKGDVFIEKVGSGGHERALDPAVWTGGGPQVLLLDVLPDGTIRNDAFGSSPEPATSAHVAKVKEQLAKQGKTQP